jgi:ribonuclease R
MSTPKEPQSTRLWREALLNYIAAHPDRPQKARGLARALRVAEVDYTRFRGTVRALLNEGRLVLGRGRALALPVRRGTFEAVFRAARGGFGFLQSEGGADVFVSRVHTGDARAGDRVAARLLPPRRDDPRPRGEVLRVIERAPIRCVGKLARAGRRWIVQWCGRDGAVEPIVVANPAELSAQPGELVVVESSEPGGRLETLRGEIRERLGDPERLETRILSVIRRFQIPDQFPARVLQDADRLASAFDAGRLDGREDLGGLLTITIDPVDARDFDDAISIEPLPGGTSRLGVHIADVAHFVRPGGALDREALRRGNSVYFPRHVVPMLPEKLSNGVCSLQPDQTRFTRSVFLDYDDHGRVQATRFARSAIRSSARLTYDDVTRVLEGAARNLSPAIVELIRHAERLARRIRQRRLRSGMIVLSLPEVEIRLDAAGRVVDAGPADTSFSHTMIEMFMVEANEAVSRYLTKEDVHHLRRVHPEPENKDGAALRQLEPLLGRRLPSSLRRRDVLELLDEVRGKPEERIAHTLLLRSLAQAHYSPSPDGHFALASDHYCHFTSPIRRYPDLVAHRLLDARLRRQRHGAPRAAEFAPTFDELVQMGNHASATERRALQAEREMQRILIAELMQTKIGNEYEVVVTGVARFGVFVQILPYLAEGVVPRELLGPERWDFDESRGTLVGGRGRRIVSVGHSFRAAVVSVDELRAEIRLRPVAGWSSGAAVRDGPRG